MAAECAAHEGTPATGSCTRCGRFTCDACLDGRRPGWCSACANRPGARLEVSGRAKVVLFLSVVGVMLAPLALAGWWLGRSTQPLEADEPLLRGARWLRWTALALWGLGGMLWFGRK